MVSVTPTAFGAASLDTLATILARDRAGVLEPALVVCPSPLAAVGIRRALGARPGGVAGVTFTTLDGLARELSGRVMAAGGAHLATEVELQAAIRAELEARPGRFGRVAAHQTTEERLVALHHQVAGMGDGALDRMGAAGHDLAADALRVVSSVEGRLGPAWTRDRLLAATLDELALLPVGARGPIILHLPDPSGPFEGRLLSALARRPDAQVVAAFTGDPGVDRSYAGRLAGWSIHLDPSGRSFRSATRLEVADPGDEVGAAVRDLVAHAASGVPLNRMALLYPTVDPYATLAAEQLTAAGLPWCGPGHRALAVTTAGRFLIRLLGLAAGGLERAAVITLASSAPLGLVRAGDGANGGGDGGPEGAGDLPAGRLSPSLWDLLSRRAGIIEDGHWEPRLRALRLEGDHRRAADDLLAFIEVLRAGLHPDPAPARWGQWVDWILGLVDRLLDGVGPTVEATTDPGPGRAGSHPSWPAAEQEARHQVRRVLDGLRALDRPGPGGDSGPDLATFSSIVISELQRQRLPGAPLGRGLLLAPVGAVAGLDLDRLVIVGVADGSFPRIGREDSLLPDRVRAESGGLIPPADAVTDLDVRAVAAALSSSRAQPVVISSRGDLRRVRSRGWPRQLDRLVTDPQVLASHHQAVAGHGRPASAADAGLRALVTHVDGGDPVHTHELAAQDVVLAAALRRTLDRQRAELNPAVGKVPAGTLDPTERLLSATALEAYAACPRSYLLGRVLRLGDEERPEQIEEITPLDRGSLVHKILEKFVATALEAGEVPEPGQPWPPPARTRLHEIMEGELGAVQARGLTGGRVTTRILHRRLSREMDLFLATDDALRAERRSTPVHVELGFGFEDAPSELSLADGRVVRLRGQVDRVDATDDGGLLVIDYKGGSGRAFDKLDQDPLDRGRRLQLPLYARVVADKLDRRGPRTALYWLTSSGRVRPLELAQELELDLDTTVGAALDGISAGLFPGVPGEAVGWPRLTFANCRYCDFDRICPTDRQREWDQIRHAPELDPIGILIEEGER